MQAATPTLSVVIPTRDRRESLLATLSSLHAQTASATDYEILVVVDGGTDGTPAALTALTERPEWREPLLRFVVQEWSGAAAARNTGLRAARGAVVLFVDDDTVADPGLVRAHLAAHSGGPDGRVVLGHIAQEPGRGALAAELARWWVEHYRRLATREPGWNALYTGNVSVPREAALAAGGLDPAIRYGEDVEFGFRLRAAGLGFVYAPSATVTTRNPKDAAGLLRDFMHSGQGSVHIYRKFPAALRELPLGGYGATSLRMRGVRRLLLVADQIPLGSRFVDAIFLRWAGSASAAARGQAFELARSFFYWRGVRRAATRDEWRHLATAGAPVLLWHSVAQRPAHDRFTVHPRRLRRQLTVLRLLRRRVVALEELARAWDAGRPTPAGTVALSFDDGYCDNLTDAWPTLRRHRFAATLFMVTGCAGGANDWDRGVPGRPHKPVLSWPQLRELDSAGFRVESHTVSHPDLREVSAAQLHAELAESRADLAAQLGRPVELFAYPYGGRNAAVKQAAQAAGYRTAFSVWPGLNTPLTDPWDRPRIEIKGTDGYLRFAAKVLLGEDPFDVLRGALRAARRRGRA